MFDTLLKWFAYKRVGKCDLPVGIVWAYSPIGAMVSFENRGIEFDYVESKEG
jgi:hypothetical protein